jgi:XTP/dITP diphosphohydrolase
MFHIHILQDCKIRKIYTFARNFAEFDMKIVFATGNKGKLREASEILGEGFQLVTPADMDITEDIPETGSTLRANSLQKAQYLYDRCGCDCFADDTGLEVDALGGAPGVYTARYAGDDKDFNKNMDKVLSELARLEGEASVASGLGLKMKPFSRRARFKSVITLMIDGKKYFFEGTLEGVIAREKSGNGGFGYDPIFIADEYPGMTLADITEEQKNDISHRGKALRAMAKWMKENLL